MSESESDSMVQWADSDPSVNIRLASAPLGPSPRLSMIHLAICIVLI